MEAFPELTTADRADIVDRVFEQKVCDYIKFVRDTKPFGDISAVLYTIEFQKRGLPHYHSLLWVTPACKVQTNANIDKYISAELPNPTEDPDGYKIISELMMHGPCGLVNKNAACMKDGNKCNRNSPKPYPNNTYIDKDGFVHYRRRETAIDTVRQSVQLDNTYVVPYNQTLCMRYYAHINVKYCGRNMFIKYLFKYISKGIDHVVSNITRPVGETVSTINVQSIQIDEIKNSVEARYIGPHEACWRMLEFPIHYRDPAVLTLAVHLENMQQIQFRTRDKLQSTVDNPTKKKTTLTEWLNYNRQYTYGRHLTYLNIPLEYTWHVTDKYWQRRCRVNKPVIGRLTYIHPRAGDLFYQRILLCHQNGCRSFRYIRTVNDIVYLTNRAACGALGLIGGDQEWINALEEAVAHATSEGLRILFVQILTICDVCDPISLWQNFWQHMSQDIPCRLAKILQIPKIQKNEREMKAGKTFLWNSLACALRLEERIVLAVASSGIVFLLLPYGRTAHSRFKIPLNLHEDCICNIKSSQLADLLREFDLIIWDEVPMNDRLISEAKKQHVQRFSSWLLNSGDGNIGLPDETDSENCSIVQISEELCIPDNDNTIHQLINFICSDQTFQTPSAEDLQKKVIVCPKNKTADMINTHILSLLNHERRVYLSSDEATPHGNDGGETELLYPNEYLNTLNFARLPPHRLELKIGAPIILLRNLNLKGGLCNGTRMTVIQLLSKVIEARIITEQWQERATQFLKQQTRGK
nr:DNA helicase [Tanacetum cinerariifolium]